MVKIASFRALSISNARQMKLAPRCYFYKARNNKKKYEDL